MRKIFFTSDLHINHYNLIVKVRSQFKNCEEHSNTIIKNWNSVVSNEDLVYIIGDVVWDRDFSILNELNGEKKVVKGNHDNKQDLQRAKSQKYICNWSYYEGFTYENKYIFMCHFPMLSWNRSRHGSFMAYGHCHGNQKFSWGKSMDVGVDCNNFTPVYIDDFVSKLEHRENTKFYSE